MEYEDAADLDTGRVAEIGDCVVADGEVLDVRQADGAVAERPRRLESKACMRRSKVWAMILATMLTLTREMISTLFIEVKEADRANAAHAERGDDVAGDYEVFDRASGAEVGGDCGARSSRGSGSEPEPPVEHGVLEFGQEACECAGRRGPWLESSMKLPKVMPLRAPPVRVLSVMKMSLDGPAIWIPPQARYLNQLDRANGPGERLDLKVTDCPSSLNTRSVASSLGWDGDRCYGRK